MHWSQRSAEGAHGQPLLPDLLAEYGRLAARLADADPLHAERLQAELRELDVAIDTWVEALGLYQL